MSPLPAPMGDPPFVPKLAPVMVDLHSMPPMLPRARLMPMPLSIKVVCLLAFIGDALSFPDIGVLVDIMAGIGRTTFETFSTLYVTYQTDFVNPIVKNDIAHGGRDQVAMLFSTTGSSPIAALRHAGHRMNYAGFFFFLDPLVDFFAMNGDFFGRSNTDSDLISLDA